MRIDTLINARWTIPVEPHKQVLEWHAVALANGRIADVLPQTEAAAKYVDAECVEHLNEHILLPGLVNAHTHAAMNLLRGIADDLPLMEWLTERIWPLEARWVGESFVKDGTLLAIAELIRGGVTCFNDMYFFPDVVARLAAHIGIRATVGLIVLDFPTAWAENAEECLSKGLALHDDLRHHPLIRTALAPHAPYSVADEALRRVATLADEIDIPIHMHVHETASEVAQSVAQFGVRPLERLARLGLCSPRLVAVHMTQLLDAEIEFLAGHGVHVVHCPESNLKLASGFCPSTKLIGEGVNLALGTDGTASNNDLDMLGEMRTAALLAKGIAGDATAFPAHYALRAATLNGARALNLDHEIGSLAIGKAADIIAVRTDELSAQPVYDPIAALVYSGNREHVTDVWVAGRRLLRDGAFTTLDPDSARERCRYWQAKLVATNSH